MTSLTLRNIDDELKQTLTAKAKKLNFSLNNYILNLLKDSTGLTKKRFSKNYDDLDDLSGSWSKQEFDSFNKNTKEFDKIDKEIWK